MHTDMQTERGTDRRFTDEMVGYEVRADSDSLGHIDRVTFDNEWAVVVSGLFKKHRRALPTWAIRVVDVRNQTVLVGLTKDEIEASPDYDEGVGMEDEQGREIASYYDGLLSGRPHVRAA
jgi:hypothetical protein